jgi:hypothetical protein
MDALNLGAFTQVAQAKRKPFGKYGQMSLVGNNAQLFHRRMLAAEPMSGLVLDPRK